MKSTTYDGELLKNYLKGAGKKMGEIAELLEMTRQNLNYHLRKPVLDADFERLLRDKLKINFQDVKSDLIKRNQSLTDTGLPPVLSKSDAEALSKRNNINNSKPLSQDDFLDLIRESQYRFQINDNSMAPKFPRGCYIALSLKQDDVIVPGSFYVLQTIDNLYMARVYKTDNDDYHCIPTNPERYKDGVLKDNLIYPPYIVPHNAVKAVYDILMGANKVKNSKLIENYDYSI